MRLVISGLAAAAAVMVMATPASARCFPDPYCDAAAYSHRGERTYTVTDDSGFEYAGYNSPPFYRTRTIRYPYSGRGYGYAGFERLPVAGPVNAGIPSQSYYVNQGPYYDGPGAYAPVPVYQQSAVRGAYGEGRGGAFYPYTGGPYANALNHYSISPPVQPVIQSYTYASRKPWPRPTVTPVSATRYGHTMARTRTER